jgi:sugar/nucleoside kinase (ribokinase family)
MMSDIDPEVIVAGHICLDIFPVFNEQTSASGVISPGKLVKVGPALLAVGGSVANTGLTLHRLGITTRLMGKVGDDLFGQAILETIKSNDERLAEHMIVSPDAHSSYSIIISPPGRDRTFLHHPGVNDTYSAEDIPLEQLSRSSLFHFGYPPIMRAIYSDGGVAFARLLSAIKERGVTTSLDMALPDPESEAGSVDWLIWLQRVLPSVDVFAPSEEEIKYMLGYSREEPPLDGGQLAAIGTRLLDMGTAMVVLKVGEHGLYLRTTDDARRLQLMGTRVFKDWRKWQQRELLSPCFRVEIAGTTGAGDCTIAGFLAAILHNVEPEETLLTAVAVGAYSVERTDATSGVPSWANVQQRIQAGWQQDMPGIPLPGWQQNVHNSLWRGPYDRHG